MSSLHFLRKFQLMTSASHQTKTPVSFWCRQELNLRSLIQLSETLPVELDNYQKLINGPILLIY